MAETTTVTIGCDLGDSVSTLCILGADGALDCPEPIKTTREAFRVFFTRPAAHVILEVGTHSRWVSQLLEQLGHRVTVANPRRLKLISMHDSKNDRTDAEQLARLGRADVDLLALVKYRGTQVQADLAVAKARDALVGCRTRLVNFARGLVKSFGERLPACETEAVHTQAKDHIPAPLQPALRPVLHTLAQVHEQICACDKQLQQLAKKYPDVEVVSQPKGVGLLLTALVFILSLEDKGRFTSSRQVGAYLGLRPRQSQSGDTASSCASRRQEIHTCAGCSPVVPTTFWGTSAPTVS
jgi:transposase